MPLIKNYLKRLISFPRKNIEKLYSSKQNQFEIYSDDIFLVAYPKSGSTWLRFLIGNYLTDNKCDFTNQHIVMPDIYYSPEKIKLMKRPRIIKSHEPYNPNYPKVIYLVRDGRDVAVSYYYHLIKFRKISENTSFERFIKSFNENKIDKYSIWGNHVYSWLNNKHENLLLIKYEDLILNTKSMFKNILNFAGFEIIESKIDQSIHFADFDNMQKMERSQGKKFEVLSNSNSDMLFVRSGKPGEWEKHFSKELLESFIKFHGAGLLEIGYI